MESKEETYKKLYEIEHNKAVKLSRNADNVINYLKDETDFHKFIQNSYSKASHVMKYQEFKEYIIALLSEK